MPKFLVQKLVRDNLNPDGDFQGIRQLNDEEFILALKDKLVEEALEAKDASTREELIDELADIYDIVSYICETKQINQHEIEASRDLKHTKRGGFDKRQYVESVSFSEEHRLTQHCRAQPDKYTEVSD